MKEVNGMKAFVLAGGKDHIHIEGCVNKAILPIEGKPMLQYIVHALRDSAYIDGIAIVGDVALLKEHVELDGSRDILLQGEEKMIDNVIKGLDYFQDQEWMLLITSDIPFIHSAAIDHFIQASLDSGGDLCYPIISKETQYRAFPEMKRTYVRLREGSFTGGNMMMIRPRIKDNCVTLARHMIENRKKPWRMVQILGLGFLVQLLLGMLTVEKLENRIGSLAHIKPKAIITPYPEVGNDIDKPEDVDLLKKYWGQYQEDARY